MVWWNSQIILMCLNLRFLLKILPLYLFISKGNLCISYNKGYTFDLERRD